MDKMLSLLQHRYLEQTYELEGLQARFEWISGVCDEDLLSALLSCMSDVGATDAQLRRHIKDQEKEINTLRSLESEYRETNEQLVSHLKGEIQKQKNRQGMLMSSNDRLSNTTARIEVERVYADTELKNVSLRTHNKELEKTSKHMMEMLQAQMAVSVV